VRQDLKYLLMDVKVFI